MTLVLVVEDDPTVRSYMAETLTENGYAVRTAADGRSALSSVDEERPDAVVTESIMQGIDGWSLAARLRMRDEPIPVVVMSTFDVESPVSTVHVLPRPITPADLCAAVAEAIE